MAVDKNAIRYLAWLKGKFPSLYNRYIKPNLNFVLYGTRPKPGLDGWLTDIGTGISNTYDMVAGAASNAFTATTDPSTGFDTSGTSWWDRLLTALPATVTAVGSAYINSQLVKTNLERAKQGLPFLNTQQYQPGVGVNVGLTRPTQNLLMYGALGLAAVYVLMTLTKRR